MSREIVRESRQDAKVKNDFSKGSIPKTILRLSVPMTVAQLINILYNMVDRMFIGHMPGDGRLALTGVGITMPIITILIGFANLCGMGGSPLSAMARGRDDMDEAESIMGNAFSMLLILGVALTAIGLLIKRPLLYLFGASDDTVPYANAYLTIYLLGTIMVMISLGMNPFINSQGFAKIGMLTVTIGAVTNVILDPILIYACHMGVRGAALATIISQTVSAIWAFSFLSGKKAIMRLRLNKLRLRAKTVGRIVSLGISNFTLHFTTCLVQSLCNKQLQIHGGDLYVSVMTVINSIREFGFAAINGVTNGSSPVISFNYGAQRYDRIRETIRVLTISAFGCAFIWWALTLTIPDKLISIFNRDPELIAAGVPAFRIYFMVFGLTAFQLSGQVTFLSLGKSKKAIFFSMLRKAIIVTPLVLILPHLWGLGVKGIFLSEPISIIVSGLACYITMFCTVYIPMGKMMKEQSPDKLPDTQ